MLRAGLQPAHKKISYERTDAKVLINLIKKTASNTVSKIITLSVKSRKLQNRYRDVPTL